MFYSSSAFHFKALAGFFGLLSTLPIGYQRLIRAFELDISVQEVEQLRTLLQEKALYRLAGLRHLRINVPQQMLPYDVGRWTRIKSSSSLLMLKEAIISVQRNGLVGQGYLLSEEDADAISRKLAGVFSVGHAVHDGERHGLRETFIWEDALPS